MHLQRPGARVLMDCTLAVCSQALQAAADCTEVLADADCPDCKRLIKHAHVAHLLGGEILPTVGEMLTHLLAHGDDESRLVQILRHRGYHGFECLVNGHAFGTETNLWDALANAVSELAKGA